jgi:hypothetical protein
LTVIDYKGLNQILLNIARFGAILLYICDLAGSFEELNEGCDLPWPQILVAKEKPLVLDLAEGGS